MSTFYVQKQIEYWKNTAESDFETAKLLIDNGKLLHGLFFCHLTVEKILKAHYVKSTGKLAPKTHKLFYLLENIDLVLDEARRKFLTVLQKYQLEGRYPENEISVPEKEEAKSYLIETKGLLEWLIQKL